MRSGILKISISQNKNMPKIKKSPLLLAHRFQIALCVIVLAAAGLGAPLVVRAVTCTSSSDCQQQIDNLNNQNAAAQQSLSGLKSQAASYQDAINRLQAQIDDLQQQISSNQAQQAQLQQQIITNQQQIDQEKSSLADDVRTMYIDGQMTTIEELATSKNLSDYVDKEQYRTAVQNQLDDTIQQIAAQQVQLQQEKQQVDQLLSAENTQNTQLSSSESQQSQLLGYDQSQQDQFNSQIQTNNSQIEQLQAEKVAQLRALGGTSSYGGTGSYPWASAPCLDGPDAGATCGNYDWGYPSGSSVPLGAPVGPWDPWGYEYRNCTSYVAWKISSISTSPIINSLISGLGNAADWPDNVPQSWIDATPRANDAAVVPYVADGQGHVMFVQSVNGDGTINVSQYNVSPGAYSETYNMSTSGLQFIHFPGT